MLFEFYLELCNSKPSKPKCPSQCTVEIKNLKTVMTAQYAYQRMVNKYQGMVNKYQRSVSLYMSKLESCKAKGGSSEYYFDIYRVFHLDKMNFKVLLPIMRFIFAI